MFVGPFDHHSNILPWRESYADVVVIKEDLKGALDVAHLEKKLKTYSRRKLKIGEIGMAPLEPNLATIFFAEIIITGNLENFG